MIRAEVKSSNIKSIGWSENFLEIEFNSEDVYQYSDVPMRIFTEMMASESKGSYFYQNIKGKFPWKKLFSGKNLPNRLDQLGPATDLTNGEISHDLSSVSKEELKATAQLWLKHPSTTDDVAKWIRYFFFNL